MRPSRSASSQSCGLSQSLPRILEVFSLYGLFPTRCHSAHAETDPSQLVVDVQVAGLPFDGVGEQIGHIHAGRSSQTGS